MIKIRDVFFLPFNKKFNDYKFSVKLIIVEIKIK